MVRADCPVDLRCQDDLIPSCAQECAPPPGRVKAQLAVKEPALAAWRSSACRLATSAPEHDLAVAMAAALQH
jgi:hypothetical protein